MCQEWRCFEMLHYHDFGNFSSIECLKYQMRLAVDHSIQVLQCSIIVSTIFFIPAGLKSKLIIFAIIASLNASYGQTFYSPF